MLKDANEQVEQGQASLRNFELRHIYILKYVTNSAYQDRLDLVLCKKYKMCAR